jgi:hypothetical protein
VCLSFVIWVWMFVLIMFGLVTLPSLRLVNYVSGIVKVILYDSYVYRA